MADTVTVCHAAVFRHTTSVAIFELHHQLPVEEELWNASSAAEWALCAAKAAPCLPFLSALKSSLNVGLPAPAVSAGGRIIILIGLLSVALDMNWYDPPSLLNTC